jgi:branched-chain amino acid transport system substrate-binding protein
VTTLDPHQRGRAERHGHDLALGDLPGAVDVEDNGLFFRTAPSDARQGVVMAEIIMDRGFDTVAVTYTNNDYGQGLADSFAAAFEEMGGTVTLVAAHEDGKADYSAEVGALASAGGDVLVVAGYVDQGGPASSRPRSTPVPSTPSCCPTAWSPALTDQFRLRYRRLLRPEPRHRQRRRRDLPAGRGCGLRRHLALLAESYDAAALIMLAMQAAGSTDPGDYAQVMDVANAPGHADPAR